MLVRYLYTFPFFQKRKTSKVPFAVRENLPDTEVFEILSSGICTYYLQINLLQLYHFSGDKGLKAVLIRFLLTRNISFNPCRLPI